MKVRILKIGLNVLTIYSIFFNSIGYVSADTWPYGNLTKIVAASNGGGTQWDTYRQVGLSVDDQNIHIYVSMDPYIYDSNDSLNTGDRNAQLSNYVLTIAGETLFIDGYGDVSSLNSSQSNQTKTYSVNVGSQNTGWKSIKNAMTVTHLVRDNGNRVNNIMTITLPLKELGIALPATTNVTLTNTSIWAGAVSITVNGASSGPWALAIVGLIIALIATFRLTKSMSLDKKGQEKYAC
ncbi:Firmicu-CTERM sorting domain-containing protein [Leuconostoc pseudomesenteroides]|uniref:Firmicu-CTERM sorting domain-containing protein n=1 Tax=Leuconostoc pseudomesenteroides TaxID=33968 RepID=UPI001E2906EE|nr:Firmicu-CTERM sorting domain-containing protein [Leuconostoc pseudomesenteroides]MCC8440746.1 Firmicu-CTERM sorting domain-containing protein [Leuconostoc pseudomesenteroides]